MGSSTKTSIHELDERIVALAELLLDQLDDPSRAAEILPEPNFWDVIHYGESSYENRYNRMVRWLLDPGANHDFGTDVVNALISEVGGFDGAAARAPKTFGMRKVLSRVETAVKDGEGKPGRIDVTVEDGDRYLYVAVESKLRSEQGADQLARYRRHVDTELAPTEDGWSRAFVFLTEDETAIPDDPSWRQISYVRFAALVSHHLQRRKVEHRSDRLITDFLVDITRRARAAKDQWATDLFYEDARRQSVRFGDLILSVIEDQSRETTAMKDAAAKRLRKYAPEEIDGQKVLAEMTTVFASRGRSGSDALRALAYVWASRPPVQDKRRDVKVQQFYRELAALLGDDFARTGGKTGQGGNLTWGKQRVWIAGNGRGSFVSKAAHTTRAGGRQCELRDALLRSAAAQLVGVPVMTASSPEWTPVLLRDALKRVLSSGETCSCGVVLDGP